MRLPLATALLALVFLIVDAITPAEVAVSWAYVVVILFAGQFLSARGVVLVTVACAVLTVAGFVIYPPTDQLSLYAAVTNCMLSVLALAGTAFFVVRGQAAARALREQTDYLALTHDGMFSRTMDNAVSFWNRGAEELYGWSAA
jgi:hypothetical protein